MIHGFITKYRIERKSCHKFISIIKIIFVKGFTARWGWSEEHKTTLYHLQCTRKGCSSKATQRTAQFCTGGEQEEAGTGYSESRMLSQYFPDNHLWCTLSNHHEHEIIVYFPYEMGRNYFLHLKDQMKYMSRSHLLKRVIFCFFHLKSDLQLKLNNFHREGWRRMLSSDKYWAQCPNESSIITLWCQPLLEKNWSSR